MVERLKKIPTRLLEIWNKYTSKQKTFIISVTLGVFLLLVVLIYFMSRTQYEKLTVSENTKDASVVVELLESEGIEHKLGTDNVTVYVDVERYSDAVLLLASNDMPSSGLSLEELLDNSLSTKNSDRTLKLNLFLQDKMTKYIKQMEGVEDASIYYIPVDNSNTILSQAQDTSASIMLTINDDFKPSTAKTIATSVASMIGNTTSDKIRVADQYGNLLFGGQDDLYSGNASSNEDYKERLRNTMINNIHMGLLKLGYDDVEVMPNLEFNMDIVTELYTEYTPAEGNEQGLYEKSYTYESEGSSTSGGTPGTDANDETSYQIQDQSNQGSSVLIEEFDYLPNERVTNTEYEVGAIVKNQSSISIVLTDVITFEQEDLELQGVLEDTTFEEYALANNERVKVDVDEDIYKVVSLATGIAEDRIQIVAYEQPMFIPTVEEEFSLTEYLPLILAILIIGLLIFVVIRSAAPVEVTELEPELSVEQLLATTKENQYLDDIEFNDKSETRKMIEKFVDENPEAVAQLLRNWLGDDGWE